MFDKKNGALHVSDLSFWYGESRVLRDVTFYVDPGEFFIVIGPNGSGKTTLMKLIGGFERYKTGSARINGQEIRGMSRRDLSIQMAYVPQFLPGEFPFTVRETVLMGRTPHQGFLGLASREDRVLAMNAMGFTGILHLADRQVGALSGGEKQRVSLARAICQQPEIILLDEPTASLDVAHQLMVMDLMERLKKEHGVAVVMVSHDINLASMYADRLLLMKSGEVVIQGTPDQVLREEILQPAYGCSILVNRGVMGDYNMVMPVPGKFASRCLIPYEKK